MSGVASLFKKSKVKKTVNLRIDDDAEQTAGGATKPKKKSSKKANTEEEDDDEWKSSAATAKKAVVVVNHTKGVIQEFSNDRENASSESDILMDDTVSREDKLALLETKNLLKSVLSKNQELNTAAELAEAEKAAAAAAPAPEAAAATPAAGGSTADGTKAPAPGAYNAMERIKARLGANNSLTSTATPLPMRRPGAVPTAEEFPDLSAALKGPTPTASAPKQPKVVPPPAPAAAPVRAPVAAPASAPAPAPAPTPVTAESVSEPTHATPVAAEEVAPAVAAAEAPSAAAAAPPAAEAAAAPPATGGTKKKKKKQMFGGDIDLDNLVIE